MPLYIAKFYFKRFFIPPLFSPKDSWVSIYFRTSTRKVFSVLMKRRKFCWQLPFPEEEKKPTKLVFTLQPCCGFALKKRICFCLKKEEFVDLMKCYCVWKPSGTMNKKFCCFFNRVFLPIRHNLLWLEKVFSTAKWCGFHYHSINDANFHFSAAQLSFQVLTIDWIFLTFRIGS